MSLYPLNLESIANTVAGSNTSDSKALALAANIAKKALDSNPVRTSFIVINNSNQNAFFGFKDTVSPTSYVFPVPRNTFYEFTNAYPWLGEVWAIAAAGCNLTITEISK